MLIIALGLLALASGLEKRFLGNEFCECGITDGKHDLSEEYASSHAWPWMASIVNISLEMDPVAYCGATLINDRYLISAAHCIPDMNTTGFEYFRLYLGTNTIYEQDAFLDLGIDKIISHPKFDFDSGDYDIAILKLTEPVKFSKWIRPICLRQVGSPFIGRTGILTGWGSFNVSTPTDHRLKQSKALVVSNESCAKNYTLEDIAITERMICATPSGNDPCKGDSGGPLMIRNRNKFSQIGIVSHGEGCGVPNFPSIFSRVESFLEWITELTSDAIYCTN